MLDKWQRMSLTGLTASGLILAGIAGVTTNNRVNIPDKPTPISGPAKPFFITNGDNEKVPPPEHHSISINSATEVQLQRLPRIGPVIAKRIVEYRKKHKQFKTIQEMKKVSGIGDFVYKEIEPFIRL